MNLNSDRRYYRNIVCIIVMQIIFIICFKFTYVMIECSNFPVSFSFAVKNDLIFCQLLHN